MTPPLVVLEGVTKTSFLLGLHAPLALLDIMIEQSSIIICLPQIMTPPLVVLEGVTKTSFLLGLHTKSQHLWLYKNYNKSSICQVFVSQDVCITKTSFL